MNAIITFQDGGQDFTFWQVEKDRVVDSQPFQADIWTGARILNASNLKKGGFVRIKTKFGDEITIKYPIKKMEIFTDEAFGHEVIIDLKNDSSVTRRWPVKTFKGALNKALLTEGAAYVRSVKPLSRKDYQKAA